MTSRDIWGYSGSRGLSLPLMGMTIEDTRAKREPFVRGDDASSKRECQMKPLLFTETLPRVLLSLKCKTRTKGDNPLVTIPKHRNDLEAVGGWWLYTTSRKYQAGSIPCFNGINDLECFPERTEYLLRENTAIYRSPGLQAQIMTNVKVGAHFGSFSLRV